MACCVGWLRARSGRRGGSGSLVVGPHPEDVDDLAVREHFVDEAMLDVDASGEATRQVADQLLVPRRRGERVLGNHLQELLRLGFQPRGGQLLGVLLRLARVDQRPATHQSSSVEPASTPSARAWRIDSASPGTDSRNSVSWIACQSASPTRTAFPRWPVMVSGSDSSLTWSINRYRFARADVALTAVISLTSTNSVRHYVRSKQARAVAQYGLPPTERYERNLPHIPQESAPSSALA